MTPAQKLRQIAKRGKASQVIDYVGDNEKIFKSLINTYIEGPYRLTQSLSGSLTEIVAANPSLLKPHIKQLVDALNKPDASTALKRNTIRMFQFVRIPGNRHGQVIDICFRFLNDRKETIAVRVFSMTVLEILTRDLPELRRELQIMIEDEFPYAGPAFRSRGSKMLKRLSAPVKTS